MIKETHEREGMRLFGASLGASPKNGHSASGAQ